MTASASNKNNTKNNNNNNNNTQICISYSVVNSTILTNDYEMNELHTRASPSRRS